MAEVTNNLVYTNIRCLENYAMIRTGKNVVQAFHSNGFILLSWSVADDSLQPFILCGTCCAKIVYA